MAKQASRAGWGAAAIYVLLAGIFLLDVLTPLGIADGMLYSFVIVYHAYFAKEDRSIFLAAASTVLILLGFFGSEAGSDLMAPLINRGFSIALAWSIAIVTAARGVVERVHLPQLRHELHGPVQCIQRSAELMLEGGCWNCEKEALPGYLRDIQSETRGLGARLDGLIDLVGERLPAFARSIIARSGG